MTKQETSFLREKDDLVAVLLPSKTKGTEPKELLHSLPQESKFDSPIIVLAFAFVATIIVFKVVPRIMARLVISALVGIASLCTLAPSGTMSVRGLRDRRRPITV